jgi:FtsH-binding integral membrane protein
VGVKTNSEDKSVGGFNLNSKFMRVFLVLVAALLVFAGPTYVPYVLVTILNLNQVAAVVFGFVLLATGLALMLYLIRKKIIE